MFSYDFLGFRRISKLFPGLVFGVVSFPTISYVFLGFPSCFQCCYLDFLVFPRISQVFVGFPNCFPMFLFVFVICLRISLVFLRFLSFSQVHLGRFIVYSATVLEHFHCYRKKYIFKQFWDMFRTFWDIFRTFFDFFGTFLGTFWEHL